MDALEAVEASTRTTCRSCQAQIVFVPTGKDFLPVNREPDPAGNIRITALNPAQPLSERNMVALVTTQDELPIDEDDALVRVRWMPHFATCTDPGRWRQK